MPVLTDDAASGVGIGNSFATGACRSRRLPRTTAPSPMVASRSSTLRACAATSPTLTTHDSMAATRTSTVLLRQYFRKGKHLARIRQSNFNPIAAKLNQRPRKRYGFQYPNNDFSNSQECCTWGVNSPPRSSAPRIARIWRSVQKCLSALDLHSDR